MAKNRITFVVAPVIGLAVGILLFEDVGLSIVFAAAAVGGALCLVPMAES